MIVPRYSTKSQTFHRTILTCQSFQNRRRYDLRELALLPCRLVDVLLEEIENVLIGGIAGQHVIELLGDVVQRFSTDRRQRCPTVEREFQPVLLDERVEILGHYRAPVEGPMEDLSDDIMAESRAGRVQSDRETACHIHIRQNRLEYTLEETDIGILVDESLEELCKEFPQFWNITDQIINRRNENLRPGITMIRQQVNGAQASTTNPTRRRFAPLSVSCRPATS